MYKSPSLNYIKAAIISVYIIFFAGSVVRMTGAGMGCPDWPKCFGYYIPPTTESQITWLPNTSFKKGVIVIYNDVLYTAKRDLTTTANFNVSQWEKYTKHNYAVFNVYHTWTEYINRLSSVVAGFVFIGLLFSVSRNRDLSKKVIVLCYLAFFGMLVEAWLGKTVVDSNLSPYIITIHMLIGLLIITFLVNAYFITERSQNTVKYHRGFGQMLVVLMLLMAIQILLGTQVRQFVDTQIKLFGFEMKELRLLQPDVKFYIHRSFTILVVLVTLYMSWLNFKFHLNYRSLRWVGVLLFFEALTGVLMYYINFPFGTQAIHLLSGSIIYGVLIYMFLTFKNAKRLF